MTILLVQSDSEDAGGAGTGAGMAFPSPTTAGNALFMGFRLGADTVVTVTDSQGNVWTEDVHQVQVYDGSLLSLWSAPNCVGGANTVTYGFADAVTDRHFIAEYSGLATSSIFDKKTSSQSGSSSSTTPTSGSVTPAQASSLVLGVMTTIHDGGGTIAAGSGYTLREAVDANYRIALEDKVLTSASAQTASFTLSAADIYNIAIAVYKGADAGTPGNASGAVPSATASAIDATISTSRSVTLTLKNGSGLALNTVARRFWTRTALDAAASDGGVGGLSVTCSGLGVFALTGLTVLAGPGWLTHKDPADDLNCHIVPVTFL